MGNTCVERNSTSTHKSFVEVIEKGNVALVYLINQIHEANLQIEKIRVRTHEEICYKNNWNISNYET